MTDLPLHLFSHWRFSHFCNSKLPINLNHTKIKETLRNDTGYKKVKMYTLKKPTLLHYSQGEMLRNIPESAHTRKYALVLFLWTDTLTVNYDISS